MTLISKYILSWENILVKSLYYEKGKKGREKEYPPFFSTTQPHPRNNSFASQYHLIKLLYFSSSLKLDIKKKNPLRDEKKLIF
jgi:hypothetical protein